MEKDLQIRAYENQELCVSKDMNKRVKGKKRERESKWRAMDICNTYIR